MKTLFFALISFCALAQKDTTITTKKVVNIGDVYYVQTTTTSVRNELLDTQLLKKVEDIEADNERRLKESREKETERKELVKLVKQAVRNGYKPKSDNSYDDGIYNRILNKINKEKL